jgi:dipeptide/tripeptide permease
VNVNDRTRYPAVFWIANSIEVLERFAYYGIYLGFGIYMEYLGYTKAQLGVVQTIFLFVSYVIPIISGTFADRFGFKKVLIISYLAYLPSILLLIITKSFSGIALTMLSIGLAAGIFKPLVSGTVRAVTDKTNKTLGFGIFYMMVNVGASFGPIIAGKLRAISWNYAFGAAAVGIAEIEGVTLGKKFQDLVIALSDLKFAMFLLLLGLFFWIPFWAFFNLLAIYIDRNLDTAQLYLNMQSVMGTTVMSIFSAEDQSGTRRILGETISHTGFIIMVFQVFVSKLFERFRALPTFLAGLAVAIAGFLFLTFAKISAPAWVLLGIFLFAVGEMISSPRIQEYITWIAPKEKAGLYMGANFLALGLGAFSGVIYTPLYGYFREINHPEYVWLVLAAHTLLGIIAIYAFTKSAGEFEELEE